MKENKFIIGSAVRCIKNNKFISSHNLSSTPGAGWIKNRTFIVDKVEKYLGSEPIYFAKDGHGVFESFLELIPKDWDE